MSAIEIKVDQQTWNNLTANLSLPASRDEAITQNFQPLTDNRFAPPTSHNVIVDMILPNLVILRNPTNVGPCGLTFDANGKPVPVYPDPNTGLCNSPLAKQ